MRDYCRLSGAGERKTLPPRAQDAGTSPRLQLSTSKRPDPASGSSAPLPSPVLMGRNLTSALQLHVSALALK